MGNKKSTCTITGLLSCLTVLGSIVLVPCTGGAFLILGGVTLGAGISGAVNSFQQYMNNEGKFSRTSFLQSVVEGGVTGLISGGSGAIVKKVAAQGTRQGIVAIVKTGAQIVGGSASGTAKNIISCGFEGRKVTFKEVGKSLLIGGLAATVGPLAGNTATRAVAGQISKVASKGVANAAVNIVAGCTSGGIVGGTVQAADNYLSGKDTTNNLGKAIGQGALIGGTFAAINQVLGQTFKNADKQNQRPPSKQEMAKDIEKIEIRSKNYNQQEQPMQPTDQQQQQNQQQSPNQNQFTQEIQASNANTYNTEMKTVQELNQIEHDVQRLRNDQKMIQPLKYPEIQNLEQNTQNQAASPLTYQATGTNQQQTLITTTNQPNQITIPAMNQDYLINSQNQPTITSNRPLNDNLQQQVIEHNDASLMPVTRNAGNNAVIGQVGVSAGVGFLVGVGADVYNRITRQQQSQNNVSNNNQSISMSQESVHVNHQPNQVIQQSNSSRLTLTESYLNYNKQVEGCRYQAYRSPENNGTYTIGIGHLLSPSEQQEWVIQRPGGTHYKVATEDQVRLWQKQDLQIAEQKVKRYIGSETYRQLSNKRKEMLVEYAFNGIHLTRTFPRFTQAVINNDYATMRREYKRSYRQQNNANGNSRIILLSTRNQEFYDRYLVNEEDD